MSSIAKSTKAIIQGMCRLPPELRAIILQDKVIVETSIDRDNDPMWVIQTPAQLEAAGNEGLQTFLDHIHAVRHPLCLDVNLLHLNLRTIKKLVRRCKEADAADKLPIAALGDVKFEKGPMQRLRVYVLVESIRKFVNTMTLDPSPVELESLIMELQVLAIMRRDLENTFVMVFGPGDANLRKFLFARSCRFQEAVQKSGYSSIVEISVLGFVRCVSLAACC